MGFYGIICGDEEHWERTIGVREEEERVEFGPVGCETPERHPSADVERAVQ